MLALHSQSAKEQPRRYVKNLCWVMFMYPVYSLRTLGLVLILFFNSSLEGNSAEKVTTFRLDNGLQVVVIEDHRAPVVVNMIWYKAGAADEEMGKSGVAHFLEHLLFKATNKLKSGEFSRIVEKLGGSDNAFTSWDYTAYYQRVSRDHLGLMMELEADRMKNINLTKLNIETERKVVLEERAQRTDSNPGSLFAEQRRAAMYLNHPYGIPIIGWRHEIEQLNLEDTLAFYSEYYSPSSAIAIVAGDVTPTEVQELAIKHYGPLKPNVGFKERRRNYEPPHLAERRIVFEDKRVSQPYVIRTYLAEERDPGNQQKAAIYTVLAELLGGNETTSVLGKALQIDTKKALYTSAFYSGISHDISNFGLLIVPIEGTTLEQAEADLDMVIRDFIKDGVDENQLQRIKAQIRASEIYAMDDVFGLARSYGAALTSQLSIEDVKEWPKLLGEVSSEQVLEAARTLEDKKIAVTGWYTKPPKNEDR
jgi:zinc protease